MKSNKRFLSLILVLSMIMGLFSNTYVYAYSDRGSQDDSYEATTNASPTEDAGVAGEITESEIEPDGVREEDSLDISEVGDTVTAETDGFSHYTVEFTYDEKQYVMEGDTTVALNDILSFVGITKADGSTSADSDITDVSVSDASLFSASDESGEWMVTAHQAFHTDEWMKVTADGVEYEIVVTDATTYTTSTTFDNSDMSSNNGSSFVINGSASYSFPQTRYIKGNAVGSSISGGQGTASIDTSGKLTIKFSTSEESYTLSSGKNAWKLIQYTSGGLGTAYYFEQTYVILTVDPTYTAPTAKTMTYTGSPQTLVNTGTVSAGGTMEYALGTSNTTVPTTGWSTLAPTGTDAGTYYVWYRINAATGYNAVVASCVTSSIGKANNPVTYANQTWSFNYATTLQTKTLAAATNAQGTVTYSLQSQTNGNTTVNYFSFNTSSRVLTANANTPVGTYTVVVKASAVGNNNYNSGTKSSTVTVTINNASMDNAVSATGYSGTYDGSAHGITVTAPSGATVKYSETASGTYNLTSSPTYTNVGTYTVYYQVTKANYTTVTGSQTVTINKKEVTISGITASSKTYDRSDAATLNTDNAAFTGKLSGDTLTVSATGTFDNMNVGTGKTVTISNLTLRGASAGNYQIAGSGTQTTTTADITAKSLTVTAEAKTKIYGTSDPALTYTSSGLISGDSFTGALSRTTGEDVGTYAITQGTLTAGSNYAITYTGADFTITKATPVITGLSARTLTYDKTEQALVTSGTASGGTLLYAMTAKNAAAPGDDAYTEKVPVAVYAGTYTVYYKVVGNNNYVDVAPASVDVTIAKKPITINGITAKDKVYDSTTDATLVYSGINWEDCGMIAGDNLTISATGTFSDTNAAEGKTITISNLVLGGDTISEYVLANDGQQTSTTATISKKVVGLEWHIGETVYDGKEQIPSFIFNGKNQKPSATATGLVEGDICNVTVTGEKINVGAYTATASALSNPNYKLPDAVTIPFTITPRTITTEDIVFGHSGTLEPGHYEYTGDVITPAITVSTVLAGDSQATNLVLNTDYSMSRDITAVSTGTHYIRFEGKGNYDGTVYKAWNIDPTTITVKADSKSKTYGDSDPELTVTVTGPEDAVDEIEYTVSRVNVGGDEGENVGEYVIRVEGKATQGDYKVNYVDGIFTIEPAPVTVTAKSDSKYYGDADPAFTSTVTGLKRNDTESVIERTISRAEGENAGSYTITPDGAAIQGNYSVTYKTGTLTIRKRKLATDFVHLNPVSFQYDGTNKSPNVVFDKYDPVFTTDYTISGETTANDRGMHSITVSGAGTNFSGSVTLYWYITGVGDNEVTYDGLSHTINVDEDTTGNTTYKEEGGTAYSESAPVYTEAGSYTIYYKTTVDNPLHDYIPDEPEKLEIEGTAVLTIKPAPITVTAENQTKIYGEDDPELTFTVTGLADGDRADKVFANQSLSRDEGEDVGSYTIRQGELATNGNYYIETFNSGTLKITKRPPGSECFAVRLLSDSYDEPLDKNEVAYNGKDWTVSVSAADGITGLGAVTLKYYVINDDGSETELTSGNPKDAGKYRVKLEVAEGANYAGTGDELVNADDWRFEIVKTAFPKDVMENDSCWPSVITGLTYDGTEQPLLKAPENTDGVTGCTLQYSTDGEHWSDTIPTGKAAGSYTIYAKYVGDENHADSETKTYEVTIDKKANAKEKPDESFTATKASGEDTADGTISGFNSELKYEYSDDDGETWKKVTGEVIEGLGAGDILIRYAGDDITKPSDSVKVTVGVKENQSAPDKIKISNTSGEDKTDGAISGVDDKMEYSTDDGVTWKPVEENSTTIENLPAGEVLIRYQGDDDKNPGEAVKVTIKVKENQDAPDADKLAINYTSGGDKTDGVISGVDDKMEYSTDDGVTWRPVEENSTTIEDLPEGEVLIRYQGDDDKNPGETVKVTIGVKENQPAPDQDGLKADKTSGGDKTDGVISGVDDKMEYSTDGGETWKPVEKDSVTIDKLPAGEILIRYKDDGTKNPSEAVKVTIGTKEDQTAPKADELTVTNASDETNDDGKIEGFDKAKSYQYSSDNGTTWNNVGDGETSISVKAGTYKIRIAGDDDHNPSEAVSVTVGVTSRTQGVVNFKPDKASETGTSVTTVVENAASSNIEEFAATQMEEGSDIKVELEIIPKKEEDVSRDSVTKMNDTVKEVFAGMESESIVTEYLEIDLAKYVDNAKEGNISDTKTPLEIELTYDKSKTGNPIIIRTHNGMVKVFEKLMARPDGGFGDGTYHVADGKLYLYSQYFSDFAIVYATEKTYYVNIDLGNGESIQRIVGEDDRIELPDNLTREGCSFGGLYKDASYKDAWNDTDKVKEDTTLYAKWNKSVTGVTVDVDNVSLTKTGETAQIKVHVIPEDAADKKVTFTSSDPKVATVDADGKLTAVASGTAIITVKTEDGDKKATIKVTVAIPDVPKQGTSEQPKATEQPKTTEHPVEEPTKEEKAAISMNAGLQISQTGSKINIKWGKVKEADGYDVYATYCGESFNHKNPVKTIKKNSTTSVTVKKINGRKINLKKNFKVYVAAYKMVDGKKVRLAKSITGHIVGRLNTRYSNVRKITLSKSKYTVKAGKTVKVKAKTVLVEKGKKQLSDAHTAEFRYASSNENIAIVDKNGKIKGVAKGTCTIYVYARNGYAKTVSVTVK